MAAFELTSRSHHDAPATEVQDQSLDPRRLREECIIALKVYDSCRQQDCLTEDLIGPARAAECTCIDGEHINEGDIIVPPRQAAAVTIDRLRVKKIIIVEKKPNPFKKGFWDIDIKYVFEYRLTFREADGNLIGSIKANSIFNKKVTLFGSNGSDIVLATDLFSRHTDTETIDAEPFILVEAKAVELSAEIRYRRCGNRPDDDSALEPSSVDVTIGLFTIIKLFRIVNLTVQSRGFCIPPECEEISPLNPCDFFERLDFPMDIFAPPQRPEFLAGISGDIPRTPVDPDPPCGCD